MNWEDFLQADCKTIILDWHRSLHLWFLNVIHCGRTCWTAEGSYEIGSIRPSVRFSFLLSGCFFGFVSLIFSKVWHGARILCEVLYDRAEFSAKFSFAPKLGKWTKNGPKTGVFFNLLENLVIIFCWISSVMKIHIICCVPAKTPYLGKFLFLRYGPKCFQPIRFQDSLINLISRTNQWNNLIFHMLSQFT